jgi:hypothetical protein
MNSPADSVQRRPRTLAHELVDSLGDRIRDGRLAPGVKLPTEAAFMAEFRVSRTVVREAISKLQAAGSSRRGTASARSSSARATARRSGSAASSSRPCDDVIAMLELRIGVEVEAAGLGRQAPHRRKTWRRCASARRVLGRARGRARRSERRLPVSSPDHAGDPQPPLHEPDDVARHDDDPAGAPRPGHRGRRGALGYLRRVNAEHESILRTRSRTAMPRRPGLRCAPTSRTAASGAGRAASIGHDEAVITDDDYMYDD